METVVLSKREFDDFKVFDIPVASDYRLHANKKLGSGAFGEVYYGTHINSKERFAIKLENMNSKNPQLLSELDFYLALQGGSKKFVFKHINK